MRTIILAAAVTCASLTPRDAAAQPPLPAAPVVSTEQAPSATPTPLPVPPPPASAPGDHEALFSMDVMLGMQTGVRGQIAAYRGDHFSVLGEAYYGMLVTRGMGTGEGAGVGGRAVWRRGGDDGGVNALVLGPGLNVYFEFDRGGPVLLTPSVDLAWLHGFGDRCGWETGLDVGVGVGVSGGRDRPAAGEVTPLISVYTGFRF